VKTFEKRFLFVTGKGGVGKTTVCASLARALSQRGRRVLLCASDTTAYGELLPEARWQDDPYSCGGGLFTVQLQAEAALREYGRLLIKPRLARQALFENRYVQGFLSAVPGLPQWAQLGKAWYHTTQTENGAPRFDTVLLDAPATGHGLELLRLPKAIAELSPAGLLRRDADLAWQMLRDPAETSICLVTLPEELPTNETLELAERIETELGLPLGAVALNRTSTAVFSDAEGAQLSTLGGLEASEPGEAALRAAALCAIAERVQAESIARLSQLAAPLYRLPDVDPASPRTLVETLTNAFTSRAGKAS